MKKLLFFFFGILLSTASQAQLHRYNTNFTVSRTNFVDTIPISYDGDQVFLTVTIHNRPYRFILDTGSSQGMLYQGSSVPILNHLGGVISHDANGVADTIGAVQLPPFQLGDLEITGYVASVVKAPRHQPDYDGIIGFDLFNKGIGGVIDTRKKILILSDRKKYFDDVPGYPAKYQLKWFVPYILVSPFMRHVDEALFDTGAQQLYQINKTSFDEHAYKSKQVNAQVEGRATGQFTAATNSTERRAEVVFLKLDRLKWGDFAFTDVHTITTQGASRIGAQILNYGAMVINPKKKVMTFQPYDGPDSVKVGNKQFGIAFIDVDNAPQVGLIWNQSTPYRNGLRQGDVILKVNGTVITSYNQFTRLKLDGQQKTTLIVRDKRGFNKEVIL